MRDVFLKESIRKVPFLGRLGGRGVGWTSLLDYRTTDNCFLRFENLIFFTRLPTSEQLVFRLVLDALVDTSSRTFQRMFDSDVAENELLKLLKAERPSMERTAVI